MLFCDHKVNISSKFEILKLFNNDREKTKLFGLLALGLPYIWNANVSKLSRFFPHSVLSCIFIFAAQTSLKQTYNYFSHYLEFHFLYFTPVSQCSCSFIVSDLCIITSKIRFDLVCLWTSLRRWMDLSHKKLKKNKKNKWKPSSEKEGREENKRTGSLWYSLWISLCWLHCKVPEFREEIREVFIFHRNRKFTAQQRGLDFALVQARHSSKFISYLTTKALSVTYFFEWPGLGKKGQQWESEN